MSVLDNIFGTPQNTVFNIYTNDVSQLNPASTDIAIQFGSLYDFMYTNQVNVAYEPLENSQFSSDSVQDTPFTLAITAIYAPVATSITNANTTMRSQINAVIEQMKTYLYGTTLLTILQTRPLFDIYQNLKLTMFNYELTNQNTVLYARMTFQEIRTTTAQYSGLQQNKVSDPQNTSQVPIGNVTPVTPNVTNLDDIS